MPHSISRTRFSGIFKNFSAETKSSTTFQNFPGNFPVSSPVQQFQKNFPPAKFPRSDPKYFPGKLSGPSGNPGFSFRNFPGAKNSARRFKFSGKFPGCSQNYNPRTPLLHVGGPHPDLIKSRVHSTPNPGTQRAPFTLFSQTKPVKGSDSGAPTPCSIENSWIFCIKGVRNKS